MPVHAGRLFLEKKKKKNLLYLLISHVKLCHPCVFFPLVTLMDDWFKFQNLRSFSVVEFGDCRDFCL